ncbi:MAG: SusC/RagA family TonB-linked outer membrane protein [Flavobacterium sp.]
MRSKFKWIFTLLVALSMQFSFAQEKTVTGTITDGKLPLPGANVVVKGTTNGVSTDMDGKFSIKAKAGDVLVVSFTGYDNKTLTVGAANNYKVALNEEATVLNEVIIGALGIKRTKDATPSAQKQIGAKELTQAANPNAIQSLTGKVSGLQINTTSNGVTADTRIVLRGNRSITGNNQALIVIDGAISSASVLAQLPPDVIENVNVIKGAQGAALYGEQGVNGAILVTTKKGSSKDKFTFGVNSSVDFESISFVPDVQREYGQGWATDPGFAGPGVIPTNVPFENGSWGPAYNNPAVGPLVPTGLPQADGNFLMSEWKPIKDNIKQFFQTGTIYQNGFNFNVGGPESYAFLSVNRQTTDFVVDRDKLVRNSFLFKAGKKVGKFNIEGNVNYITQRTSQTNSGLFEDLIQTPSNIPVSKFGELGGLNQHHWTVYATSPYWTIQNERYDNRADNFNGILNLGYEINKNISVNYTANVQMRNTEAQAHKNAFSDEVNTLYNFGAYDYYGVTSETYSDLLGGGGAGQTTSFYYANQSTSRNIYGDLLVNFDYDLTKDVNLKFNIGNNIQDRMFRETSQGGTNLDVAGFYNISNVLNPDNPTTLRNLGYNNQYLRSRRVAAFANVDLAYKDYLFLNATSRVERSSVIKDSYFYPSVGVSFIPTKAFESLKGNKVLNYAKLNASYTSVGNSSAVSPYQTNDLARIGLGFPFNDLAGLIYNTSPTDPNIKPEFVNTLEVGAQFGFFKDRITLEGSYYVANTKDLITSKTASSASGNASLRTNVGDLQNKGFEIDLGLVPIKTANFRWDLRTNFSTFKTKITSLAEGFTSVNLQSNAQIGIFAEVGEEFPLIKGTTFVRDENGNVIVDANGNPTRNSTFKKLGKGVPDYIIGLTNSFEYKGLKLTVVADFRTGASTWSETANLLYFTGGDIQTAGFDRTLGYVIPGSVTATGAANTVPTNNDASYAGVLNYFTSVHRAAGETSVIDAAALKIRELSLSYGLPKKLIEKTGLESFRVGINARNPFVFLADGTLIKAKNGIENNGYGDPEAANTTGNAQGIMNIGQYPTTRTLGFTVNLTF